MCTVNSGGKGEAAAELCVGVENSQFPDTLRWLHACERGRSFHPSAGTAIYPIAIPAVIGKRFIANKVEMSSEWLGTPPK
jgi:hypothetical protein